MERKEYERLSLGEKADYWMGKVVLAIARGEVRNVIVNALMTEHSIGYKRGKKEAGRKSHV